MNKKVVIGCLAAVVAVLAIGGGLAYYYVVRPLTNTVKAGVELTRIADLERQVTNKSSFRAPADSLLSERDVERFMQVSNSVINGLQSRASELEAKYKGLSNGNPSVREVINAYADIIQLVVSAKELQVRALNSAGFSLEEYAWVRNAVLEATGHSIAQVNLTALAQGNLEEQGSQRILNVPEQNVELVAPFADRIGEYVGLAMFGL